MKIFDGLSLHIISLGFLFRKFSRNMSAEKLGNEATPDMHGIIKNTESRSDIFPNETERVASKTNFSQKEKKKVGGFTIP